MRRDLAFESPRPAARERTSAARASSVGGQAVVFDEVSVAANQRFIAVGAARVLPRADHTGKISRVDVSQACLAANFSSPQQIFGTRIALTFALHLVVGVKSRDVPWDVV